MDECVVGVVLKTAFKPFSAHGVEVKFVGFIGVETGFVFGVIPRHGGGFLGGGGVADKAGGWWVVCLYIFKCMGGGGVVVGG